MINIPSTSRQKVVIMQHPFSALWPSRINAPPSRLRGSDRLLPSVWQLEDSRVFGGRKRYKAGTGRNISSFFRFVFLWEGLFHPSALRMTADPDTAAARWMRAGLQQHPKHFSRACHGDVLCTLAVHRVFLPEGRRAELCSRASVGRGGDEGSYSVVTWTFTLWPECTAHSRLITELYLDARSSSD